jgi:DNA-binding NarL/FixJ family response regulator
MNDNKIDILIVEDNKLFKDSLCGFINQSDELVCNNSFSNCEDAIVSIVGKDLTPDIILLDIGLPGMSGVEGIKHFNKLLPNTKIIMLTIYDDNENIFDAVCNGASGYLLKDSSPEKIIVSIMEVLQGGASMNSSIANKVLKMFRNFVPEHKDYQLSEREVEILQFLTNGLSKKQIAENLFISYHTVDSHIRKIYNKLEVHSSSAAVAKVIKEKLI